MGKKYIIELPENTEWIQWIMVGTKDHHPYMDWKLVEDLTPYTEPDLERVRKEAYRQGYDTGYGTKVNEFYEQGLFDAWEAARDIHRMPDGDILDLFPDCYASVCTAAQAILKYDASEAIAKIKEYEDGKQEIKVGDEVKTEDGMKMVIAALINKDFAGLGDDGRFMLGELDGTITRTGRHFPEIAAVLEKMRG